MTGYGFSVGSGQKAKQKTAIGNPERYTVRCPRCRALFSIDVSGLEGHEPPRFHCSQCDLTFRAEEAEWRPYKVSEPSNAAQEPRPEKAADQFDFSFDENNTDFDFQASSLQGKQWQEDTGVDTSLDWDISQPKKKNEFDITANIERKIDVTVPKEIIQTKQKTDVKSESVQLPLNFDSKPVTDRKPNNFDLDFNPKVENFTYREPLQSSTNAIATEIPGREPNRWFSTFVFAAPYLILLIALAVASVYLVQTPFNDTGLLRSFLPSTQKVPPPGLILSNISFKRVALQSGEIVHLISGTLQNHTERSFKEVVLEGLGFDAGGQKVSALKVNAGATLVKTRVESFSPEMINELQGRESVRHFDLEPGDEQPFTLGLLSDDMNAAKYYSARIYSAN